MGCRHVVESRRAYPTAPVPRLNISIVGAMNAGKSTLMNLLTQSSTSIVDSTPGTTADTKVAFMEIHALGPVKLVDTPGANESGALGLKKREKALQALKESDLGLFVVDVMDENGPQVVREILASWRHNEFPVRPAIIFNLQRKAGDAVLNRVDNIERTIIGATADKLNALPTLAVDFHSPDALARVLAFVRGIARPKTSPVSVLPPGIAFDRNSRVLLNIPMDGETPTGRLLRPQAMMQEAMLRDFVSVFAYRMDLSRGRSPDAAQVQEERARYRSSIQALNTDGQLKLIVTDSQAVKEAAGWSNDLEVPLTTFSIAMAHYMSGGRLPLFIEGLRAFQNLKPKSKVLICEACNHDRIQDDIGTVQIPTALRKRFGNDGVIIEHSFGRQYQTKNLHEYSLILHCGGCMLDQQQMSARLADLELAGVPISNYGLLLSYLGGPAVLERVLKPWQLNPDASSSKASL